MDTCANHIYTTLFVALSDYMFTTFAVGRTYVRPASCENKLLLEPKEKLSLLILHPVAARSWSFGLDLGSDGPFSQAISP